jgi:hypothetical protein
MKSNQLNNENPASESKPPVPDCYGHDMNSAALLAMADSGIRYILPYSHFLYAELIANPALQEEPDAPPEMLLVHFACGDVTVTGCGLKRVADHLQQFELKFVRSTDRRLAAAAQATQVAAVKVNLTKEYV